MDAKGLLGAIISQLPTAPRSFNTDDNFWANGAEILCPSETACETLAEFFKAMLRETNVTVLTGWYDPFEDSRNGERDDLAGFNYIRFELGGQEQ